MRFQCFSKKCKKIDFCKANIFLIFFIKTLCFFQKCINKKNRDTIFIVLVFILFNINHIQLHNFNVKTKNVNASSQLLLTK